MGANHFHCYLVPSGSRPVRNAEGRFEGGFLQQHPIPEELLASLRSLLPRTNHWGSVEEFVTDSAWGSDLRISHEDDGSVSEIGLRYAPVADPIDFLKAFVEIARMAGCDLLVSSTGEVISPSFDSVEEALLRHRAVRFISNPRKAIKEAANETNQTD